MEYTSFLGTLSDAYEMVRRDWQRTEPSLDRHYIAIPPDNHLHRTPSRPLPIVYPETPRRGTEGGHAWHAIHSEMLT